MWYWFLQAVARMAFMMFFQIRAIGRENVPVDGPLILASNHQSFLDPPLVGACLSRQVHYMARKTLFEKSWLFARLIHSLNAFPVERDRGDVGAVRETLRRLRKDGAVLVFPEATRTLDGTIGQLKPGVFMMAVRARVPVVPAVIDGAFESWPRWRPLPRPYPITVAYGRAMRPEEFGGDAEAMAAACAMRLEELQAEARAFRAALKKPVARRRRSSA